MTKQEGVVPVSTSSLIEDVRYRLGETHQAHTDNASPPCSVCHRNNGEMNIAPATRRADAPATSSWL
jgi:hypothetical protein